MKALALLVVAGWFSAPKADPVSMPRPECLGVRADMIADATTDAGIAGGFAAAGIIGMASAGVSYALIDAPSYSSDYDDAKRTVLFLGLGSAVLTGVSAFFLSRAGDAASEAARIDCPTVERSAAAP